MQAFGCDDEFIFGRYIYFKPVFEVVCYEHQELQKAFLTIQEHRHRGYFVGYISYESSISCKDCDLPLLHFVLFLKRRKAKKIQKNPQMYFYPNLLQNLDKARYIDDFARIKQALKSGQSYQINYTQELHLKSLLPSKEIFARLCEKQHTRYVAYLKFAEVEILSFSPELFFKLKRKTIHLEPMKGTIKRGKTRSLDKQNKALLAQDSKNRSENVMIVDLLRNDLSRLAKPKSLKVKKLFCIKTYQTLHQMISILKAKLKAPTLNNLHQALFPCGSITGAPKKSTMNLIASLEQRQRGIYCGGIGVISKNKMTFSVPIRTLFKKSHEHFYRYGVGSGVVWDSKSEEEFQELELKSKFLFPRANFYLFETMLGHEGKIFLSSYHKSRLQKSALALGFDLAWLKEWHTTKEPKASFGIFQAFCPCLLANELFQTPPEALSFPSNGSYLLRLVLFHDGKIDFQYSKLTKDFKPKIHLSNTPLCSANDLLAHKTSHRPWYENAIRPGFFDCVFVNQNKEITEGSRSNIVILKENKLLTPSLDCGLLDGVLRRWLLESGVIVEARFGIDDLKNAQKIFCINSVRGALEVELCEC